MDNEQYLTVVSKSCSMYAIKGCGKGQASNALYSRPSDL